MSGVPIDLRELEDELHLLAALEQKAAERAQTRWIPHKPTAKQKLFLELDNLEALFGGAAGGGKSDALLMDALAHVDVPNYSALLLRRTYTDLAQPEGLMDRARQWLSPTAAEWSEKNRQWRFPSGATLSFGFMENDADRWRYQGGAYQFIGWDELTQHTEKRYAFMLSRCRRTKGGLERVPLKIRGATNPGGIGHKWVASRFGITPKGIQVEDDARNSRTGELRKFIPSKLADNPHLDQEAYRNALAGLDEVTRQQLEDGLWILDSQGLIYPYTPANLIDFMPAIPDLKRVLAIDIGASEAHPSTAFVVSSYSPRVPLGTWHELAEVHAGMDVTDIALRARELQNMFQVYRTVMDEGALGKGYGLEMRRRHRLAVQPAQKADKLGFRKLYKGAIQRRHVHILRGTCKPLIEEAATVQWNERGDDVIKGTPTHCTDAALYGWRECTPYASQAPDPPPPKAGTPEWFEAECQRMIELDDAMAAEEAGRPWWVN